MRVVVAGASGLVGGLLLPRLSQFQVAVVARRALDEAPRGVDQLIGPVEAWPELVRDYRPDIAISCLGTTIRDAGSQEAFAAIDRDAVVAIAGAARSAGAVQFLMVSSVGANARARNFYLRTKGEAEAAAEGLGYARTDIFRPGLLRGNRRGAARPGEKMMIRLAPITDLLTPHVLDQYRSIAADDVAAAIAACVGAKEPGSKVHENRDMLEIRHREHRASPLRGSRNG